MRRQRKTKNEKRNSNPFFSVISTQKTKNRNGNGIPFYKAEEKRKIKMKFECHFFYAIEKRLALKYTHSKQYTFENNVYINFQVGRFSRREIKFHGD